MRNSVLLLLALALGGCTFTGSVDDAFHRELVAPYRLDSGDRLRVIVFGQNDLTNTYEVDQAGNVTMPLIGAVAARGRTASEVEADVSARLLAGYLRDPDVSIEIDRYRPYFAMGEVNASGQYAFVPGMTVQQAIAAAGGFTARADKMRVQVTRSVGGHVATANLKLTDPILPGDTLYVRERIL